MATDILLACAGLAIFALGFLLGRTSHPRFGKRTDVAVVVYDDGTVEVERPESKDDRSVMLEMASEAINRRRWGGDD